MAKKIAFVLELEGGEKLVSNLSSVELELTGINKALNLTKKEIDIFNNGTKEQIQALEKQGKSLDGLEKDYKSLKASQIDLRKEQKELNREIREQGKEFDEVKNKVPKDSLVGLRREYKNLRKEINLMDSAARSSAEGLEKIAKADSIKKQIIEIGESVSDYREQVGNYKQSILETLGSFTSGAGGLGIGGIDPLSSILGGGLGGGVGDLLGGIVGKIGPVGVAIGSVVSGAAALYGYMEGINIEFEKLESQTKQLTGLQGAAARQATVDIKTITEVYDRDFNEVLRAANTLTKELTGDFDQSIELIQKGFLAGADASGEFLDSIREYSTQFREAGGDAEDFVEILIRSTREGIYSDKGIDAVKEFGLRIREQTNTTKTALVDAFGEEFTQDLFDNINVGSTTTIEALQLISTELSETDLTAKQTGQILADVFGGPGEDAGLRFIETLKDVGTGLDDLIDKTDPYIAKQLNLIESTRALNQAQSDLANQLASSGTSWEALGKQVQTAGVEVLNYLVREFRARREIFQDTGSLLPSGALVEGYKTGLEIIDQYTGSQIEAGEQAEELDRRQQALLGNLKIADLREEQAKLREEIDSARASGEDYTKMLEDYNKIADNITAAQNVLSNSTRTVTDEFKKLGEEGSIARLADQVSQLEAELKKSGASDKSGLFEKLAKAKVDLAEANKQLKESQEQFNLENIQELSIEQQVEIYTKAIERKRVLEIQAAQARIDDEKELQRVITEINENASIEALREQLKLFKEGSTEYIRILNDITSKGSKLEDIKLKTLLADEKTIVDDTVSILESVARTTIENEEELSTALNEIRLYGEIEWIKKQLDLADLSTAERLKLEADLIEKQRKQREEAAKLDINYSTRLKGIADSEAEAIALLIPEFDPNNIAASLKAIEDFEDQRRLLKLEKQLETLELEKELLLKQGEDITEINNQIALQQLDIEKETNKKIIEEDKKRIDLQKKLEEDRLEVTTSVITEVAQLAGAAISGTLDDTEKLNKALLKLMLDTVEKVILLQVASASAQSFAQADSVATFGISGAARAAILTALIKGAFGVAKSAILSEEGNLLGSPTQGDLRKGLIFSGNSHKFGGDKFILKTPLGYQLNEAEGGEAIIKRAATGKWLGLLSAINEDGGGKRFAPDSDYWKKYLLMMQGRKFASGDITGSGIISSTKIPQLVNPQNFIVAPLSLSDADLDRLAKAIQESTATALKPALGEIPNKVAEGMEEGTRLRERKNSAQQNSQI